MLRNSVWFRALNAWNRSRSAIRSRSSIFLSSAMSQFHWDGCRRVFKPAFPNVPNGARVKAALLKLVKKSWLKFVGSAITWQRAPPPEYEGSLYGYPAVVPQLGETAAPVDHLKIPESVQPPATSFAGFHCKPNVGMMYE